MATPAPFSMAGRRCLVTGATDPKSIGYACAQALLAAGAAHVAVMGRDQAKVEGAVAALKGEGESESSRRRSGLGDGIAIWSLLCAQSPAASSSCMYLPPEATRGAR